MRKVSKIAYEFLEVSNSYELACAVFIAAINVVLPLLYARMSSKVEPSESKKTINLNPGQLNSLVLRPLKGFYNTRPLMYMID